MTHLASPAGGLVPQPPRPSHFPIRVPCLAEWAGKPLPCEVLGATGNVLLVQGLGTNVALPPLGTPVRLRVEWDRQLLSGRLAAHGVASRFLVSLGERAIRRSRRFPVDLPGTATSAHLYGPVEVRVRDLSAGGARIDGLDLPVGSEVIVRFTPPGHAQPLDVAAFVVRAIGSSELPTLGIAFRLAQPSVDALTRGGSRA